MSNYSKIVVEKAIKSNVDEIYSIIQKRCEWLDNKNINQWNVTRTYGKDYYIQKINEGKFYVAKLGEKVVRYIYASIY